MPFIYHIKPHRPNQGPILKTKEAADIRGLEFRAQSRLGPRTYTREYDGKS